MNCILHVIGTDTVDLTPSLILVCGNRKYLFNAGEGTQRLCLEHFVRMGQIDAVLFTRLNWEEIGGFPGMILTTSETGMRSLSVCGPPGVEDFVTSTRFFLQRNDFVMHVREFKGNSPPPFVDNLMRIYPIVLDPSNPKDKRNETKQQVERKESEEGETNEREQEDALTGIAYIPSARKNQKLFIRKQNVEQVVSLMFSKRRQLTELEEIEGQVEYYDTSYEGRRRKPKRARKNENLNFIQDTIKMRLTCNDAKLLIHEDYFSAHPNMAKREDESDDEDEPVLGPNSAPVGVVPDTTPLEEKKERSAEVKDNSTNENTNPNKTTNTPKKEIQSDPKIAPQTFLPPQFSPPSDFKLTVGTSFESASLSSFPSLLGTSTSKIGKVAQPIFGNTTSFGNTSSPFGSASPFPSLPFPAFSPSTQLPASVETKTPTQVTDIFGSTSAKSLDVASLFGNSSAKLDLGNTKLGNNSLFSEEVFGVPPEPIPEPASESRSTDAEPTTKREDIVLCYACHMQDVIRLDLDKAIALGVPSGPLHDELREGKTVKSATTGNDVTPQDCLGDPIPGPAFLVIYCPSLEYMSYIIHNKAFAKYFEKVEFVVHLTHHDALSTDEYKQWMHKFNTIQHIIVNKEVCTHHYVFPTSAIHQYRMNSLHKEIFPIPYYKEPTAVLPNKCNCCCGAEFVEPRKDPRDFFGLPKNTSVGEIFLQMTLYPENQQGVDRSGVILRGSIPRCQAGVKQLAQVTDLPLAVEHFNQTRNEYEKENPVPNEQPRLLFLGTASALPSKYRNVSGIYFEPIPGSGMLLDAGEGSYGMLYRRFGEKLKEIVASIKAVWISHIHADHHLGLIRILLKRKEFDAKSPLMVIGPRPVGRWLSEYEQKIQTLFYDFVDCADITSPRNFITPFFENVFGFKEIYTMEVMHCAEAFGLVMTHKNGWKFVISGDTRPCPKIEEVGKDAFLLIHEATLETGLEKDAHERGHSTCGQAIECFKRMNAKWVILTHFSQRYPSIPKLPEEARDKIGIAYDLMDIRWSDIPLLPHLLTPMGIILNHEEKSREKAAQRTRNYYAEREKKLVEERKQAKRIKYHFAEDDEEEEGGQGGEGDAKNTHFNRMGRGRGAVRGFCVDPTKRRGKVDR